MIGTSVSRCRRKFKYSIRRRKSVSVPSPNTIASTSNSRAGKLSVVITPPSTPAIVLFPISIEYTERPLTSWTKK
ncbi:unnamed protein product [Bacillus phage SPP1]|uniref:Bacteriophage SPP1 complete nucleotide sequence n=1 Tax=Bacillus phage SPP1 TaxID=10724 RepID=O48460_BPSPP|nr:hypothetical protein SPP1p040 [Bacillus phage SPP1]CAA66561.1 unnamed protein product [Bacillus phage SPP1]